MLKEDQFKELIELREIGLNINQAARRIGISYPTAKRYWHMELKDFNQTVENYYKIRKRRKAEVYREDILALIRSNTSIRPYKLYDYFKEKYGFDPVCSSKSLANYYYRLVRAMEEDNNKI